MQVLKYLLCFFLPPIGVLVSGGTFGEFVFNFILTLCFAIPGIIHACYICYKNS